MATPPASYRLRFTVPVLHEDEVEDGVEARHHEVRHAQVHQKVVGHVAHPPMGWKVKRTSNPLNSISECPRLAATGPHDLLKFTYAPECSGPLVPYIHLALTLAETQGRLHFWIIIVQVFNPTTDDRNAKFASSPHRIFTSLDFEGPAQLDRALKLIKKLANSPSIS